MFNRTSTVCLIRRDTFGKVDWSTSNIALVSVEEMRNGNGLMGRNVAGGIWSRKVGKNAGSSMLW
jgi:hypothetical protein